MHLPVLPVNGSHPRAPISRPGLPAQAVAARDRVGGGDRGDLLGLRPASGGQRLVQSRPARCRGAICREHVRRAHRSAERRRPDRSLDRQVGNGRFTANRTACGSRPRSSSLDRDNGRDRGRRTGDVVPTGELSAAALESLCYCWRSLTISTCFAGSSPLSPSDGTPPSTRLSCGHSKPPTTRFISCGTTCPSPAEAFTCSSEYNTRVQTPRWLRRLIHESNSIRTAAIRRAPPRPSHALPLRRSSRSVF